MCMDDMKTSENCLKILFSLLDLDNYKISQSFFFSLSTEVLNALTYQGCTIQKVNFFFSTIVDCKIVNMRIATKPI